MDQKQVEQLLVVNASKLAPEYLEAVREKLYNVDYTQAAMIFSELKDPTTAVIISVLVGVYGIDRFYIGDIGLGVAKLLTGGGCGIWWIVDMFLITNATRQKNTEKVLQMLAIY